jgi:hypothetical protein
MLAFCPSFPLRYQSVGILELVGIGADYRWILPAGVVCGCTCCVLRKAYRVLRTVFASSSSILLPFPGGPDFLASRTRSVLCHLFRRPRAYAVPSFTLLSGISPFIYFTTSSPPTSAAYSHHRFSQFVTSPLVCLARPCGAGTNFCLPLGAFHHHLLPCRPVA